MRTFEMSLGFSALLSSSAKPIAITAATLFWCSAASAQVELSVEVPRKNIRVFEPFVVNYTISNIGSDEANGMAGQGYFLFERWHPDTRDWRPVEHLPRRRGPRTLRPVSQVRNSMIGVKPGEKASIDQVVVGAHILSVAGRYRVRAFWSCMRSGHWEVGPYSPWTNFEIKRHKGNADALGKLEGRVWVAYAKVLTGPFTGTLVRSREFERLHPTTTPPRLATRLALLAKQPNLSPVLRLVCTMRECQEEIADGLSWPKGDARRRQRLAGALSKLQTCDLREFIGSSGGLAARALALQMIAADGMGERDAARKIYRRLQEGYPRSPFSDCASSWAKVFKEQS